MSKRKHSRNKVIGALGAAGILAIAGVAYVVFDGAVVDDTIYANAGDAGLVARGQQVYAANCAACHGTNLEGQPNWRERKANGRLPAPPHDATGHTWHHDDQTLFGLTKYGLAALVGRPVETDMPAYAETLSDEEIWAVLAYIKSRWPENVRARQAEISARANNSRMK